MGIWFEVTEAAVSAAEESNCGSPGLRDSQPARMKRPGSRLDGRAPSGQGGKPETATQNVVEMVNLLVGPHRGRHERDYKPAGHAHTRVAPAQATIPNPSGSTPKPSPQAFSHPKTRSTPEHSAVVASATGHC